MFHPRTCTYCTRSLGSSCPSTWCVVDTDPTANGVEEISGSPWNPKPQYGSPQKGDLRAWDWIINNFTNLASKMFTVQQYSQIYLLIAARPINEKGGLSRLVPTSRYVVPHQSAWESVILGQKYFFYQGRVTTNKYSSKRVLEQTTHPIARKIIEFVDVNTTRAH